MMRKTVKMMLLAFGIMILYISCNNEELFIEPVQEHIEEVVGNEEEVEANEDEVEELIEVDASLPCDFNLNNVEPNSTIIVNCILDLNGTTVNVPEGVTFLYEGGDIVNGTLNFSGNAIISGELLNSSLTLGGSKPQLKDPVFNFIPQRWGIVEGKVSDEVAKTNGDIINQSINSVKEFGVNTFSIDKIDAYFGINDDGRKRYAIFVPSNFNLIMTDNTNLRIQPNSFVSYALLFSWEVDNVLISGGKLWGDRYTHDYNTISDSHEKGHIIWFKAVQNGVVDNVEMHEGTGDGFYVSGSGDREWDGNFKAPKRESFNVTVKNCLINDNRRNNISIVDGTNIFIEYNTIRNAGSGDASSGISSNGTSPRAGIDVEARKHNFSDGNSIADIEKTENVHIRHNIFEDNYAGDVALFNGENTSVYENTFRSKHGIGVKYSYNNKIYNNLFERPEGLMESSKAIVLEPTYWANGDDRIIDFEVYNNTITGYQLGIVAGGKNNKIKDNTITNCKTGVTILTSVNLVFDNNIISSNIDKSKGYYTFSGETYIKNCLIKNGETNVQDLALYFSNKNNNIDGDITIDNIDFNGTVALNNIQNTTVKNSTFNNIEVTNCNPTLIDNN